MSRAVGGSDSFYARFGFTWVRAVQALAYLQRHYVARVSTRDKQRCADALKAIWVPPLPGAVEPPPLPESVQLMQVVVDPA